MGLWQPAHLPQGYREIWCQELSHLAELAKPRARLRTTLTGSSTVERPEREHWSERMVLIADELASNALRHARPPVAVALSRLAARWLVTVSDTATDLPPEPAQGRDPGLGGFGLYVVADLSAAHGWSRERGQKSVWAVVEDDRTENSSRK